MKAMVWVSFLLSGSTLKYSLELDRCLLNKLIILTQHLLEFVNSVRGTSATTLDNNNILDCRSEYRMELLGYG